MSARTENSLSRALSAFFRSLAGVDVREDPYDHYVVPGHAQKGYIQKPTGETVHFTDAAPAGRPAPHIPAGLKPVVTGTLSQRHSYGG